MALEEERADAAEDAALDISNTPEVHRLQATVQAHKTENAALKETIRGWRIHFTMLQIEVN